MNKFRFTINALAIALFTIAFATMAQAQATRTWVSGTGDDANPCSRTAPCKTFAGAISKTALQGEIDALDDGGFGALTITKAITIEGGGHTAGVLVSGGVNGIVITAGTGDSVTLRNLDFNGTGTGLDGVKILHAKNVFIDHCQIYAFRTSSSSRGISDERTDNQSPSQQLFISDCLIKDNAGEGIAVVGAAPNSIRAFIDHCRIVGNGGAGVLGSNSSFTTVRDSFINGNLGEGVKIDTNAQANVVSDVINGNATGCLNNGGSQFLIADDSIFNNGTGISGAITSFGNNNIRNNTGGNGPPAASPGQQ